MNLDAPVDNGVHSGLRQLIHADEPLIRQERFNRRLGAVGHGQFNLAVFHLEQNADLFQFRHDVFSRLINRLPFVLAGVGVEGAVFIENVDHGQLAAAADFVVVGVVRRGDFHRAGAQFGLRPDVGDERDFPVLNRQHDHSAVFRHFRQSRQQRQQFHPTFRQVCQLRFNFRLFLFRGFRKVFCPLSFQRVVDFRRVGMDGNGSVPEHGFRSGRGDGNVFRFARLRVDDRVFHVPEMPLNRLAEHFVVADRGLQVGVPVDELLAAINEVFLEERKERVSNGFGAAFVQGEPLTAPVARRAHALELSRNSLFV